MNRVLKHIKFTLLMAIVGSTLTLTSCKDFFETPIAENITNETIYSSMNNAERGLSAAYYALPYRWGYGSAGIQDGIRNKGYLRMDVIASICDEAVSISTWSGAVKAYYGDGIVAPLTVGLENTSWRVDIEYIYEEPYYYIRYAYLFLESVDSVPDATSTWLKQRKAEAKILIAICWYELIRRHGSVPYLESSLSANDDFGTIDDRPALKDLFDKVDALIVEAMNDAPDKFDDSSEDYGRVTKATAYFLRSRLWLLAASPIFNTDKPYSTAGLVEPNEICLGYSEGSDEWKAVWQKAADYSKAAIEFCESNGYSLNTTSSNDKAEIVEMYRDIFRGVVDNPEIIQHSRRVGTFNGSATGGNMIGRNLPPAQEALIGSHGFCSPNQRFIQEMFRDTDGKELLFGSAGGNNPWSKADYRFEAIIVYDGCDWGQESSSLGSTMSDNPYADGYESTGYFMRKFMHDEWQTGTSAKDVPYYYMRLPELYFNYAEALCELDWSGNKSTIGTYLNKTTARMNGGAATINMSDFTTYEAVRDEIRREKAVEFMFEDQRFFDVKRWLIADETIGREKTALVRMPTTATVTTTGRWYEERSGDNALTQMASRQRNWNDKYYLMPFPQYEINKGFGLNQNPGY